MWHDLSSHLLLMDEFQQTAIQTRMTTSQRKTATKAARSIPEGFKRERTNPGAVIKKLSPKQMLNIKGGKGPIVESPDANTYSRGPIVD